MTKDGSIKIGFATAGASVTFLAPRREASPARETAPTRAPAYRRDDHEPTKEDLRALSKREEGFPDIPPDVA